MDLHQRIENILNKYKDLQPNMASESFRKQLAKEIEIEVDKYCLILLSSLNQ
tara:strand:+ start:319 stop:474 length:156 start_codon:yes stop_codon:yes gene_type:complete